MMASVEGKRWLCVDPGETTGWSVWKGDRLLGGGQTPLWEFGHGVWDTLQAQSSAQFVSSLDGIARLEREGLVGAGQQPWLDPGTAAQADENTGPIELIVCEKFALYPWEAKNLAFDEFRTVQLIGALTFMATLFDIEMHKQPASIKERALAGGAKEFFTHPLYENRHQNDSIMHGLFYVQVECRGTNLGAPDAQPAPMHHPV